MKITSIRLIDLSFFFLFSFSTFFLTSIVSVSPFWIGFLLFVFFLGCHLLFNGVLVNRTNDTNLLFVLILIITYTSYLLVNNVYRGISIHHLLLTIVSFYFFLIPFFFNLSARKLSIAYKWLCIFSILLFFVDIFYRYKYGDKYSWATGIYFFYNFKENTLIFQDTNENGFLLMELFMFSVYLKSNQIKFIDRKVLTLLLVLMILQFSRATYMAVLFFISYEYIYKKMTLYSRFIISFILIVLFFYFVQLLTKDASFLTKIEILTSTQEYINKCSIYEYLFGVGFFNSTSVLTRYGHNYLVTNLVEEGVVGLILYLLMLFSIYVYQPKIRYLLIPYLIAGLSYCPNFQPYTFLFMGTICVYEKEKNID